MARGPDDFDPLRDELLPGCLGVAVILAAAFALLVLLGVNP